MKKSCLLNLGAILLGALLLGACASGNPDADTGVQDIQPGQKSVIQPPSGNSPQQGSSLEERPI